MGTVHTPPAATLFLACMYSDPAAGEQALAEFCGRYGPVALRHGPVPFVYTRYYAAEMGERISKDYCCFSAEIDREQLPDVKLFTNAIEQKYTADGKRRVNLDPGYLTRDGLILATTKDFFHRIYLGRGIYAEVTLHYRGGRYRYFSWTYPDYREEGVLALLEKSRARMVGERRIEERRTSNIQHRTSK